MTPIGRHPKSRIHGIRIDSKEVGKVNSRPLRATKMRETLCKAEEFALQVPIDCSNSLGVFSLVAQHRVDVQLNHSSYQIHKIPPQREHFV